MKIEERFSKVYPSSLHECAVIAGNATFLLAAYWTGRSRHNPAIRTVCQDPEWRGGLVIAQVGRITPYYRCVRNPSAVNRAVSRYVSGP